MHVRVDQTGQDVQALGVYRRIGGRIGDDAQRGDAAIPHPHISCFDAPGQHAGSVADQQVEMCWHGPIPLLGTA